MSDDDDRYRSHFEKRDTADKTEPEKDGKDNKGLQDKVEKAGEDAVKAHRDRLLEPEFNRAANNFTDRLGLSTKDIKGAYAEEKEQLIRHDKKYRGSNVSFLSVVFTCLAGAYAVDGAIDMAQTGDIINEMPYWSAPFTAFFGYQSVAPIVRRGKLNKAVKNEVKRYQLGLEKPQEPKKLPPPDKPRPKLT